MPVEIELKLTLSLKHSNRLLRLPFLHSLHTLRASTQNLFSIYYDTSDFYLKNHGIVLRLRRAGEGWIHTIKGHGHILAGLFQHREWEVPVNSAKPDYSKITDPCFQ
ncbi:MAG: CYTH domain-containing protein [Nitrosomonas sp.]|nr:CYTH domain-containing protein [Nitrosomonas sp.]